MSNIDKQAVQAVADLKAGYTLGHADVAILNELARIALALLEVEAVHQVLNGDAWVDLSKGAMESQKRVGAIVRTLYTDPPAPVSVTDLTAPDNLAGEMLNHAMNCERRVAVAYTHCAHRLAEEVRDLRAAMLQGAERVTTAYKLRDAVETIRNSGIAIDADKIFAERDALNSPAIPDGWVACSERMPTKQDGTVFLTWNGQYIGKELFLMGSFQCLKSEIITHWMPLPSPPAK